MGLETTNDLSALEGWGRSGGAGWRWGFFFWCLEVPFFLAIALVALHRAKAESQDPFTLEPTEMEDPKERNSDREVHLRLGGQIEPTAASKRESTQGSRL